MAITAGCAVGGAHAATVAHAVAFNIPPGSLSADLVKFAIQSDISLGLGAVDACGGSGRGLMGRYTVEEGLERILDGTGCGYRALDARAYVIEPLPRKFASPIVAPTESATSVELAELVVTAPRLTTPNDLSNWGPTGDLATTVSGIFSSGLGSHPVVVGCESCSGPDEVLVVGAASAPPRAPPSRPASDSTANVPEPGTWTTMLVGLGAVGTTLRRRRDRTVRNGAGVFSAD